MSCPSTPIEVLARSVEGAFAIKYPVYYEDEELSTALTGLTPNEGAGFRVETISPVAPKARERLEKTEAESLQLHARTGQILSNYRAFLTDYQNDTFDDEEWKAERGRTIANDRVFSENSLDNRSIRKDADELLQKCLFYDEPRQFPSDSSTSTNRDRSYATAAFRSSRVKYGLVALGCVLFIAMVMVGTAVKKEEGMKITPPPQNTPGWHEEMAFVLDHEDESVQNKLRGRQFGKSRTPRAEPDVQTSSLTSTTGDGTSVSEVEVPSYNSSPAVSSVDSSSFNTEGSAEPDVQTSSLTSTAGDGTSVSEVEVPSFNSSPAVSSVDSSSFIAEVRGSLPKTKSPEESAQIPEFTSTDGNSANDSPSPQVTNIEEYASNLIYNAIEAAKYDSALRLHENVSPGREFRLQRWRRFHLPYHL